MCFTRAPSGYLLATSKEVGVEHAEIVLLEGGVTHGRIIGHLGSGEERDRKKRRQRVCRRRDRFLSYLGRGSSVYAIVRNRRAEFVEMDSRRQCGIVPLAVLCLSIPPLTAPCHKAHTLTLRLLVLSAKLVHGWLIVLQRDHCASSRVYLTFSMRPSL